MHIGKAFSERPGTIKFCGDDDAAVVFVTPFSGGGVVKPLILFGEGDVVGVGVGGKGGEGAGEGGGGGFGDGGGEGGGGVAGGGDGDGVGADGEVGDDVGGCAGGAAVDGDCGVDGGVVDAQGAGDGGERGDGDGLAVALGEGEGAAEGAVAGEAPFDGVVVGEELAAPAVGAFSFVVNEYFCAGGGGGHGECGHGGDERHGARQFFAVHDDGAFLGCIAERGDAVGVGAGVEFDGGDAVVDHALFAVDSDVCRRGRDLEDEEVGDGALGRTAAGGLGREEGEDIGDAALQGLGEVVHKRQEGARENLHLLGAAGEVDPVFAGVFDGFPYEVAFEGDAVGDDAHFDDGALLAMEVEAGILLGGDVHGCRLEALDGGLLGRGADGAGHGQQDDDKQLFHRG